MTFYRGHVGKVGDVDAVFSIILAALNWAHVITILIYKNIMQIQFTRLFPIAKLLEVVVQSAPGFD